MIYSHIVYNVYIYIYDFFLWFIISQCLIPSNFPTLSEFRRADDRRLALISDAMAFSSNAAPLGVEARGFTWDFHPKT